ncbi:MAG: PEP-CTERM sorting domain-containing protein [Pseudomonadota bacterium]
MSVVALATAAAWASIEAEADILVTVQDDTTLGTLLAYSGTLDVSGLGPALVFSSTPGISPVSAIVTFGSGSQLYDFYILASAPRSFGTGFGNINVNDFMGNPFSLDQGPDIALVGVPTGFSSGELSGSMRFRPSIATLGMTLGIFEWTTDDGQTITMAIGDEAIAEASGVGAIPLPGTLPLLLAGIAGLGFVLRQNRTG